MCRAPLTPYGRTDFLARRLLMIPDYCLDRFVQDPEESREVVVMRQAAMGNDGRPHVVAYAEGSWYVVGLCHDRQERRVFRIDRILEAEILDEEFEFEAPQDFDPSSYPSNGRVFRADDEVEVPVRYSPRVARRLIERGEGGMDEDGSVVVRHRVADPSWVVRHCVDAGTFRRVACDAQSLRTNDRFKCYQDPPGRCRAPSRHWSGSRVRRFCVPPPVAFAVGIRVLL